MNKITYVTVLLLLTFFGTTAQITTQKLTPLQKAENFLNAKEEVYFSFKINDKKEIKGYTQEFSIVNYDPGTKTLIAWANRKQFEAFLQKGIPFNVDGLENEPSEKLMSNQLNKEGVGNKLLAAPLSFPLATYPTYQDYADQMALFASNNPTICQLVDIGGTTEGAGGGNKRLLFIKLSDNVSVQEQEPRMMYTSSMHGDEIAGYPLMLNLIDYFITAYNNTLHADHARVKNLLDNSEIWINPSANPDGTYYNDPTNTSVANARRANANGLDLNRNYPDNIIGPHANGHTAYELETQHFMNFADTYKFVLSANFHGGTEVVNYAWDNTSNRHADDAWLFDISKEYAVNCQNDAFSYNGDTNYMDAEYTNFVWPGVTNGNDWYEVYGGRQDYMNYYELCKETTLELSNDKTPNNIIDPQILVKLWNWNREALIDYLVQGTYGFTGVVKDASTNNPIEATITLVGHDNTNSHTTSESTFGDYYRPVKAGTYDILFEAPCYQSFTLTNQTIADYQTKVLSDVLLAPGAEIPSGIMPSNLSPTSADINWNAQVGNTFDLRYRETGSPTWIDITNQATNSYNLTGLTLSTEYEVQVRSKCDSFTSNYSTSEIFTTPSVTYCNSNGSGTYDTGVTQVSFNTLSNSHINNRENNGYQNFLAMSTTVTQGSPYTLIVNVDRDGGTGHAFAWIDFNIDGDFDDAGEEFDLGVAYTGDNTQTSITPSISFPVGAGFPTGPTRMRIAARYNSDPAGPCATGYDGEVEDYSINIISPPNETIAVGTWNDNATWLYDIPQATQDVILNHNVTVTTNETINNVVVNNSTNESGELIINPGKSLIVNGDLTVTGTNTNGILMVSSSAQGSSLIVEAGAATGIGKYSRITAVASSNGGTNDLISAPFAGDTFSSVVNSSSLYQNGTTGDYLFGPFNNGGNPGIYEVYNSTTNASTVIESGKGYRAGTNAGGNVIFTGTIRTDQVDISITDEIGNYGSWNLIGNPYPSYLSFKDFFDLVSDATGAAAGPNNKLDPSYTAVFGYDADNSVDGGESIWTIWDFNNTTYATDLIAPGQGFFVKAKTGAGTVLNDTQVTFTPSMRKIGTDDDFISGRTATTNLALAKLKLTNSNNSYSTNIYFRDINTRGLDPGYDTGAFNQTALGIYTHLVEDNNGVQLANQSLPYNDLNDVVVPLAVNADQGVQISISLDPASTIPEANFVYLEDNVKNSWSLLNSSDYTFTPSVALSGTGRFFLHFSANTLSVEDNVWNGLQIYTAASSKLLIIKGQLSNSTTANLYDLQGRLILTRELNQYSTKNEIDISSISTGIYTVKVDSGNQTKTQKVIIK